MNRVITTSVLILVFFLVHINSFQLQHGIITTSPVVKSSTSLMVKEFNKEQMEDEVIDIPTSINFIDTSKRMRTKKDLTVFVVDCSLNGRSSCTTRRIEAVQGAAADVMPGMQAAVVSCFDHGADVVMEPTSSALVAKRKLPLLQKSFMGNLGQGINKGLTIAMKHLAEQNDCQVNLVIVADSMAHGLLAGTSSKECEVDFTEEEVCDVELQEESITLYQLGQDPHFRCIVIDTDGDENSLSAGHVFATAAGAEYVRSPQITRNTIKKEIFRASQGLRKNSLENRYNPVF